MVYTEWIFFAALAIGVMQMRRSVDYAPAFRAWGFPAAPVLFAGVCALIVLNQVVTDPRESAIGLALVAAGLPVYYFWTRGQSRV